MDRHRPASHDLPIPYLQRTRDYYQALGYGAAYQWAHFTQVPFHPLARPLARSRIALITTATPFQPGQGDQGPGAPYNAGAKFYTVYSGDTSLDHDLRISHVAIDRQHTTAAEHMPASHRAHLQWTPAKLIDWGRRIGVSAAAVVTWQLEHRPHPEQGYRACLGLMRLARQYGDERLEAACARAQSIRAPNYRSVKSILECGLDRQEAALLGGVASPMPSHDNVRGPGYYGHH